MAHSSWDTLYVVIFQVCLTFYSSWLYIEFPLFCRYCHNCVLCLMHVERIKRCYHLLFLVCVLYMWCEKCGLSVLRIFGGNLCTSSSIFFFLNGVVLLCFPFSMLCLILFFFQQFCNHSSMWSNICKCDPFLLWGLTFIIIWFLCKIWTCTVV
jgi:hypothetical protein